MRIDLLPVLSKVASTVRDDFADAFTAPLSAISWAGGLRFVGYAGFVLLLKLGFDYAEPSPRLLPRKVFLSRSFAQDLGLAVANSVLFAIVGLVISMDTLQERLVGWLQGGVVHAFGSLAGASHGPGSQARWSEIVSVAGVVLAVDFGAYAYHRLMHRSRFLWQFHKVHHSAPTLNPFTILRVHPVDMVLRLLAVAVVLGAVTGGLSLGFGSEHLAANVASGLKVFAVLNAYLLVLNHSHVWVSLGPLEYVLNSPAMHAIHHSREERHFDRNFANLFSIWDVLFGSFYKTRRVPETMALGVDASDWSWASPLRLLVLPFGGWRANRPVNRVDPERTVT